MRAAGFRLDAGKVHRAMVGADDDRLLGEARPYANCRRSFSAQALVIGRVHDRNPPKAVPPGVLCAHCQIAPTADPDGSAQRAWDRGHWLDLIEPQAFTWRFDAGAGPRLHAVLTVTGQTACGRRDLRPATHLPGRVPGSLLCDGCKPLAKQSSSEDWRAWILGHAEEFRGSEWDALLATWQRDLAAEAAQRAVAAAKGAEALAIERQAEARRGRRVAVLWVAGGLAVLGGSLWLLFALVDYIRDHWKVQVALLVVLGIVLLLMLPSGGPRTVQQKIAHDVEMIRMEQWLRR